MEGRVAKAPRRKVKRSAGVNPHQHSAVAAVLYEVVGQHVQMNQEEEGRLAIHQAEVLEMTFGFNIGRR
jgi:hypothetical protein